jgi:hypothetical protein
LLQDVSPSEFGGKYMSSALPIGVLCVSGSSRDMGQQLGEALREQIRRFIEVRLMAANSELWESGLKTSINAYGELGAHCLHAFEQWDPVGHQEHLGIAEGAGVDPALLYAMAHLADFRDVMLCQLRKSAPTMRYGRGAFALLISSARTAGLGCLALQVWRQESNEQEFLTAVNRQPKTGPESWSLGAPCGMVQAGCNSKGVVVGAVKLMTRDVQLGVGFGSVLGRALSAERWQDAAMCLAGSLRAAAHSYWTIGADSGLAMECSGRLALRRDLEIDEPLIQVNLSADSTVGTLEIPGAEPGAIPRLRLLQKNAGAITTIEGLQELVNPIVLSEKPVAAFLSVPEQGYALVGQGVPGNISWRRLDF